MIVFTQTSTPMGKSAHNTGTLSPREQGVLWDMDGAFLDQWRGRRARDNSNNAIVIFPYPPGIKEGDLLWAHLKQSAGWRFVVMAERRDTRCYDIAILTCRVSAEKQTCRSTRHREPQRTSTMMTPG